MDYLNKLIDNLFPNTDSLTKTVIIVFFAITIWLFNQIKKQFDESDIKKAERADLVLIQLGQLLASLKKETVNKEEIYEKFTNSVPYLEYKIYKELKQELKKDNMEIKLIEDKVISTISSIKLKYSYQNELSSGSILFQIEGFVRPVKNIIKSLLLTFSIIYIIGYFLSLYTTSGNMLISILKFIVSLLSLILIVGIFESYFNKNLPTNMINILLYLLMIGLTIGIIMVNNLWMLILVSLSYMISLFFLFRTFQKEKYQEDEVRNGIDVT
ncbi:hypothetical protein ACFSO7_06930 [Bacillus sp. CGMCC 1.16607]|uniref:hypothetical protein n=1 Tax=Bacillus sp. CGMCC 1.16607 TaxID=3351842 RepID=UPI00362C422A